MFQVYWSFLLKYLFDEQSVKILFLISYFQSLESLFVSEIFLPCLSSLGSCFFKSLSTFIKGLSRSLYTTCFIPVIYGPIFLSSHIFLPSYRSQFLAYSHVSHFLTGCQTSWMLHGWVLNFGVVYERVLNFVAVSNYAVCSIICSFWVCFQDILGVIHGRLTYR